MAASAQGLQVLATTEEGTRLALAEAMRLAGGADARVLLLVPRIVPFLSTPDSRLEAIAIADRYRAIAVEAGVDARVRLCFCRRLDDIFRWMLGPGARIVIGGRRRRWWPTAAERVARRLERQGHHVVFAGV
jgi:hypothetical protein